MPRSSSGSAGSTGRSAQTGILRIVALHGVVGERQVARRCAPAARDGRGWRRTGTCARATAGRRSASGRTGRRTRTARGSSRWCRSRATSGTSPPATAPPEPPDEPPVMRAGVVRVARGAVVHVLAGEVVGVLAHVERADQHGAGRLQPRDQRARRPWPAARSRLILEPAQRRQARDVEQVLDGERHAGERPERLARGARRIDRARLARAPARAVTAVKALSAGLRSRDARQRRLDDARGASSCRPRRLRRSRRPRPTGPCAQASNTGAGSASSGSANSATIAASRSVTCRLALIAGFHAGSTGSSSAARAPHRSVYPEFRCQPQPWCCHSLRAPPPLDGARERHSREGGTQFTSTRRWFEYRVPARLPQTPLLVS